MDIESPACASFAFIVAAANLRDFSFCFCSSSLSESCTDLRRFETSWTRSRAALILAVSVSAALTLFSRLAVLFSTSIRDNSNA